MTAVDLDKLLSAEEVAHMMSPADRPDAVSVDFVKRRMSSGRWPSIKLGHNRFMRPSHYQEALDIESQKAHTAPKPRPSGVSPRSRMKKVSA